MYALASAHIAALLLNWKEDSLILRQRIRYLGLLYIIRLFQLNPSEESGPQRKMFRNKKLAAPTFGKVVRLARVLVVAGILGSAV